MPESLPENLLIAHVVATLFMAGVIWFVQVVHYPLFANVPPADFAAYERVHTRRTGRIVGPPMLVEAVTGGLLLAPAMRLPGLPVLETGLGAALLVVIWLSTVFLQVPCHRRLEHAFDAEVHGRLVRTNWIRTIAWTLRAFLVLRWVGAG